jgi:hypothetical protein
MFCPNCGNQIPNNSTFCPKCGKSVTPSQPQGYQQNTYQGGYQQPYQQPVYGANGGSSLTTLYVFSVVLIFLFWPMAIYGFVKASGIKNLPFEQGQMELNSAVKVCKITTIICGVLTAIGILIYIIAIVALVGYSSSYYYY